VLWQHVVLCKSFAAEKALDYGCVSCVICCVRLHPEDNLRIEICWSDFKCFNVKILCMLLVGVLIKCHCFLLNILLV